MQDLNLPAKEMMAVAREVKHSVAECYKMIAMLREYATLGEVKYRMENGMRVTQCPPAFARGIYPDKSAKGTKGG